MLRKSLHKKCLVAIAGAVLLAAPALAGTFGKVVSIGGQAADVALDEPRGVLYIANFTANRIDVMSLKDYVVHTSINVAPQPSSISLSPDGHWLAIAHFGNTAPPASPNNVLTLIDLTANNAKQTFALGSPPLGVAFGIDDRALIVTTTSFSLFDPVTGAITTIQTMAQVAAQTLPQPLANFPGNIVQASVATSGDGLHIYGVGGNVLLFRYDVATQGLLAQNWTFSPPSGPRTVSVNQDGSLVTIAWAVFDSQFNMVSQFPNAVGLYSLGTTLIDSSRQSIYAQMPPPNATATVNVASPLLQILDWDNLTPQQILQLPENLTGKSVLSSDSSMMYGTSDSGVLVLPVGSLNQVPRLAAGVEDMIFRGNFCDRSVATQTLTITDPGGGKTPFTITPTAAGVTVSPSSGVTPAVVKVSIDPNVFQGKTGTSIVNLALTSNVAVNEPSPVRLLINSEQPDQRGSIVDVPGTVVDVLADPKRLQYYVMRQDKNQVLVFDGTNNTQKAVLRTCNTPKSMAVTYDQQSLLIGCDNAQMIWVYDLDSFQPGRFISTPGYYVQSIAVSSNAVLAHMRPAGGTPAIAWIDPVALTMSVPASLGIFQNQLALNTVVSASPNGSKILVASADGNVLLYDANAGSFTASRRDFSILGGAYAASAFDQYVVGDNVLDSSLAPVGSLENVSGLPSGFAFIGSTALRTTAPDTASPGVIQRVNMATVTGIRPTRMIEAPILGSELGVPPGTTTCNTTTTGSTITSECKTLTSDGSTQIDQICTTNTSGSVTSSCSTSSTKVATANVPAFTRSLAVLYDQSAIISTTTSGFTVLPWTYDAAVAPPSISSIVSAADSMSPVAPGGLITIYGSQLNPTNLATTQIPVPTALGDSCITVNGQPMPIIFVSPTQINAQMPFQAIGNTVVIVHTPGGVSDNYNLTIQPNAPAVFLSASAGPLTNLPTVLKADTGLLVTDSNPIHRGDTLVIYLTGLGQVSPAVDNGLPAPGNPLATALTPPTVSLGDAGLSVLYAGLAPGEVGVNQINVQVPNSAPQGISIPLTITQGGAIHTLNMRVVQ
jgi:uncharacterized protein (TIGR03437 family)